MTGTSRHRAGTSLVAIGAAVAFIGCGGSGAESRARLTAGPLDPGPGITSVQITGTDVAAVFTWGGPLLVNETKHAIVLERVTVLGGGLPMVGSGVLGSDRPYTIGDDQGWPPETYPRKRLHRFKGTRIAPGADAQVVVGINPNRRGDFLLRGFRVDYRHRGRRYSAVFRMRLRLCVGPHKRNCTKLYNSSGEPG